MISVVFFFSSRRRHTRYWRDWSSDVCSSRSRIRGVTRLEENLRAVRDRIDAAARAAGRHPADVRLIDRKSVVEGKSVDLGGRRIIKKKKKKYALHALTDTLEINSVYLHHTHV